MPRTAGPGLDTSARTFSRVNSRPPAEAHSAPDSAWASQAATYLGPQRERHQAEPVDEFVPQQRVEQLAASPDLQLVAGLITPAGSSAGTRGEQKRRREAAWATSRVLRHGAD